MKPYKLPEEHLFDHQISGKHTHLIVLENNRGVAVALSDYGARIVSLIVPDKQGDPTDVVLGFDSIQGYLSAQEPYHGVTVGRFANRIASGRFTIDGETFSVQPNNGPNALHGGAGGFHSKVWDRRVVYKEKVDFYYVSTDGEEGFPGRLSVMVKYRLTDENELVISYRAETDKPTVINLTNHAFFNLNGEGNGDVLDHILEIPADKYLPVDETQIPTGVVEAVENTPFDFRGPKSIGQDIKTANDQLAGANGGYDHNYVLNPATGGIPTLAATIHSPLTGIRLDVLTTEPGLQLYTGNFLNGKDIGRQGNPYGKYGAFCLETQHFPDAPNHPDFPSTLLLPGQVFQSETRYRFSVLK
ncbi:aldose 1-epimerase [Parapedobacter pyrenivorans]|uniref:Aldose 1-epimerase n=1 Tax=Parapedobacter pyrenivorans TaxID=1305674 RepID=A0A917M5S2_9SPHI|nr:aldose epimerase family protein [Parapedobacter pyrenivorans]GGG79032.1 aldose 1-epimerase [Parapedobacter pyrenivorans]